MLNTSYSDLQRSMLRHILLRLIQKSAKQLYKITVKQEKTATEALLLRFFVVPPGIEPGTQGFSVLCSTN